MIDTDKYEGHTEGPWVALNDNAVKTPKHDDPYAFIERRNDDGYVVALSKADAQLIADAPKLLAEVKRLRMYEVAWKILYYNAIEEGRETRTRTWKEIMELVRSDVREMVVAQRNELFDEWLKGIGGFE